MVADDEYRLAPKTKLGDKGLARGGERPIGRSHAGGTRVQRSRSGLRTDGRRRCCIAAGTFHKFNAVGTVEETDPDIPAGLSPVAVRLR